MQESLKSEQQLLWSLALAKRQKISGTKGDVKWLLLTVKSIFCEQAVRKEYEGC